MAMEKPSAQHLSDSVSEPFAVSASSTSRAVTSHSIGSSMTLSNSSTEIGSQSTSTSLFQSPSDFATTKNSTISLANKSASTFTHATIASSSHSPSTNSTLVFAAPFMVSSTSVASSTSPVTDAESLKPASSKQTTVIASVVGTLGALLVIVLIVFCLFRRRRRRQSDSQLILARSQVRVPQTATRRTPTSRSQMTQTYAQPETPPQTSSTRRSYQPSSSTSDLSHPHFLGAFFTRSRRDTATSHLESSTQGTSTPSALEQTTGFMKISGRKLERWQDPELASIHSISGRIYDRDGREIMRPVTEPSVHEDIEHNEESGDENDGQRSSTESVGPEYDGQYRSYHGTAIIPGGSGNRWPP
ncbi:hypothetical protein V1509DRAFT_612910 [Lipomyces kononenkoae]